MSDALMMTIILLFQFIMLIIILLYWKKSKAKDNDSNYIEIENIYEDKDGYSKEEIIYKTFLSQDSYHLVSIETVKQFIKDANLKIEYSSEWLDTSPLLWTCKRCNYEVKKYNNTKFCPNCGAKIKENKENDISSSN